MHPVTRLGRVVQQLKSFGDLHATELEAMAAALDAAGAADAAARLRLYRDVQRDEAQIVRASPDAHCCSPRRVRLCAREWTSARRSAARNRERKSHGMGKAHSPGASRGREERLAPLHLARAFADGEAGISQAVGESLA